MKIIYKADFYQYNKAYISYRYSSLGISVYFDYYVNIQLIKTK